MRFTAFYAALLCVAFVTMAFGSGAQPTFAQSKPPSEPKPPAEPLKFAHPVIFALSLGSDQKINGSLTGTLAKDVIDHPPSAPPSGAPYPWIVPEADWDLAQYEQQCASDPNTMGGFVLLSPAAGAAVENYIALLRSNLFVRFSVMLIQCNHNGDGTHGGDVALQSPSPAPTPMNQVVWVSTPKTGINGRTSMEFFPLAVFASIYLAFAPQRIFQVVSLVAHPTPNPLPATGALVSTTTTNSTTLNATGTSQQAAS